MPLYVGPSYKVEEGKFLLWGDLPEVGGDRIVLPDLLDGDWNNLSDCLLLYGIVRYYDTATLAQAELALVLSPGDYKEYLSKTDNNIEAN